MDIVLNHTSIEHQWYQAARADSTSKYYSWYVWSKEKPKDWDKEMVFPGVQTATCIPLLRSKNITFTR